MPNLVSPFAPKYTWEQAAKDAQAYMMRRKASADAVWKRIADEVRTQDQMTWLPAAIEDELAKRQAISQPNIDKVSAEVNKPKPVWLNNPLAQEMSGGVVPDTMEPPKPQDFPAMSFIGADPNADIKAKGPVTLGEWWENYENPVGRTIRKVDALVQANKKHPSTDWMADYTRAKMANQEKIAGKLGVEPFNDPQDAAVLERDREADFKRTMAQHTLNEIKRQADETAARGMTIPAQIGQGVVGTAEFIGELAFTGGASAAARAGTAKLLGKAAATEGGKLALKAAGLAGRTLAPSMLPQTIENTADRMILRDEPLAKALPYGLGRTAIETGTEFAGGPMGKLGKNAFGNFLLKAPASTRRVVLATKNALQTAFKPLTNKQVVKTFAQQAGIHSMPEEYMEERLGDALTAAIPGMGQDGETYLDRLKAELPNDWQSVVVELAVLSVPQAARATASYAANRFVLKHSDKRPPAAIEQDLQAQEVSNTQPAQETPSPAAKTPEATTSQEVKETPNAQTPVPETQPGQELAPNQERVVSNVEQGTTEPAPGGEVGTVKPQPGEVTPPQAKQPWEMTQEEFYRTAKEELPKDHFTKPSLIKSQEQREGEYRNNARIAHYEHVKQALAEGKPVPPEVLADYPDLQTVQENLTTETAVDKTKRTRNSIAEMSPDEFKAVIGGDMGVYIAEVKSAIADRLPFNSRAIDFINLTDIPDGYEIIDNKMVYKSAQPAPSAPVENQQQAAKPAGGGEGIPKIGDMVTIVDNPTTGHLAGARGKKGKVLEVQMVRGRLSAFAVDIDGEEYIVDDLRDVVEKYGEAPKKRFTSLPQGAESLKWYSFGNGNVKLKKGERVVINGRQRNTIPFEVLSQFQEVPKRAESLLNAVRAKTDEIVPLDGTEGRGKVLVPNQVIKELRAEGFDVDKAINEGREATRQFKEQRRARIEANKANPQKPQVTKDMIMSALSSDLGKPPHTDEDTLIELAKSSENPNTIIWGELLKHLKENGKMTLVNPEELPDGTIIKTGEHEFKVEWQEDPFSGKKEVLLTNDVVVPGNDVMVPSDKVIKPKEEVKTSSASIDTGEGAREGDQLGLFGRQYRTRPAGAQETMPFEEPSPLEQSIEKKKIEDVKGQQTFGGGQASPVRALNTGMAKPLKKGEEPPRIAVAPIASDKAKPLKKIILDLSTEIGKQVKVARTKPGVGGTYFPSTGRVIIRFSGDLDTTAHEMSHYIDDAFGVLAPWQEKRVKSPYDTELSKFWWHGSSAKSGPHSKLSYKRSEGLAEYLRAWMENPQAAIEQAPEFHKYLQAKLSPEVWAKLEAFGTDIRQWAGSPAGEKILSNIAMEEGETITGQLKDKLIGKGYTFETSFKDRVKAQLLDDLAPVISGYEAAMEIKGVQDVLPSNDFRILARTLAGITGNFENQLAHGPLNYAKAMLTGEVSRVENVGGLDWLFEGMDRTSKQTLEADQKDTIAYMAAERTIERIDVMYKRSYETVVKKMEKLIYKIDKLGPLATPPQHEYKRQLQAAIREANNVVKPEGVTGPYIIHDQKIQTLIENLPENSSFIREAMILKRANDFKRPRVTGFGGGIYADEKVAGERIGEVMADPERYGRIQESAKRYRAFADAMILKPMRDLGRISNDQYEKIKEDNRFYVNMQRVMEESELPSVPKTGRRIGTSTSPIKTFQGSTKEMLNPYVSMLAQAYISQQEAMKNRAKIVLTDMLIGTRSKYEGKVQDLASIGVRATAGDENAIKVYRDGRAEYWQFEKGIHAALKGWGDIGDYGPILNALTLPGRILRSAVIESPGFIAYNSIRDSLTRGVISRTGSTPFGAYNLKDFEQNKKGLALGGGMYAGHYMAGRNIYNREIKKATARLAQDKNVILALPSQLAQAYQNLAGMSETSGRIAEYRTAFDYAKKELNYSDYDAMLYAASQSRDLLDFQVAGRAIRHINRFIPFTNAAIQGQARLLKAVRENPKKTLGLWSLYVLLPTLAEYAWHAAAGDDEEKEYSELPDWRKDMFFNFKVAPNLWITVPKPWELGVLASGVARAIDKVRGKEDAFEGYGGSIAKSMLPLDDSAIAGPFRNIVEVATGWDFYQERYFIPPYDKDVPVEDRKGTDRASRIGQLIQSATNWDARNVDHFISNQFADFGRAALKLSDIGKDKNALKSTVRQAVRFTARTPASESEDVQKALRLAKELRKTGDKQVQILYKKMNRYYELDDPKEKEREAKNMWLIAKSITKRLEAEKRMRKFRKAN